MSPRIAQPIRFAVTGASALVLEYTLYYVAKVLSALAVLGFNFLVREHVVFGR